MHIKLNLTLYAHGPKKRTKPQPTPEENCQRICKKHNENMKLEILGNNKTKNNTILPLLPTILLNLPNVADH